MDKGVAGRLLVTGLLFIVIGVGAVILSIVRTRLSYLLVGVVFLIGGTIQLKVWSNGRRI